MSRMSRRSLLLVLFCASLMGLPFYVRASSSTVTFRAVPAAIFLAPPEDTAEEGKGETKELIYKTINFLILVGGLAYVLRKPLADFFTQRSADIKGGLEEGRKALEASQTRLAAIEDKLKHLEEGIAAFKISAAREMGAERLRAQQAAAAEAEKMLESARSRMETTTRAAKLELRFFVAEEALKQAEQMIRGRLDDATRSRLVSQFVSKLDAKQNRN